MSPMQFRVDCQCGKFIMVREGAAGAKFDCSCGRIISVPSLQDLRVQAGLPPYDLSPELMLHHLLPAGELPSRSACAGCGIDTPDRVEVVTECERSWTKNSRGSSWLVLFVSMFLFPLRIWMREEGEERQYGSDKIYRLPLAVCRECRKKLRGQEAIKGCLRTEPVYERLLDKFPDAVVRVEP